MRPAWLLIGATALAGCQGSTFLRQNSLGPVDTMVSSAELRVVTSTPVDRTRNGRLLARQVVCAEPSPDVAKIASSAFNVGGAAELPVGNTAADRQLALSLAAARAEAMAQLHRLASIQLLRDGLYRACEAYANGAISDTTYAVMLSRFDDTMITMLASEMVAGNFGHKLAALGSSSNGSASASLIVAGGDAEKAKQAREALTAALNKRDAAKKEQAKAAQAVADGQTAKLPDDEMKKLTDAKATQDTAVKQAENEVAAAQEALAAAQDTASRSFSDATELMAAGGDGREAPGEDTSHVISEIHSRYINNINADALVVACITAMDRADADNAGVDAARHNFNEAVRAEKAAEESGSWFAQMRRRKETEKAYEALLASSGWQKTAFAAQCGTILDRIGRMAKKKVEAQLDAEKDPKAIEAAVTRVLKAGTEIRRLDSLRQSSKTETPTTASSGAGSTGGAGAGAGTGAGGTAGAGGAAGGTK